MGLFDSLIGAAKGAAGENFSRLVHGVIMSGRNKNKGGHDHRTNSGDNRTPAQKAGDESRRRPK